MSKNTFTFDLQKGTVSAVSMVRASREHDCSCGERFSFTADWPEGMVHNGTMTIKGVLCPLCHQPVVLQGHLWVEDFQLKVRALNQ